MAPQRPVLNQLRRTEEALAAAVERLGVSARPALAMETPRTQKPGRWAAVRRSRRHPRRTSHASHGEAGARTVWDFHALPDCKRWLRRLVQLTLRLHERACKPQAPRSAPRTVAPNRPRGLSTPRGGMRSNARECRYRSVVAGGTASQWLGPSGHMPRWIPSRYPAEGSRVGASRTSDPRRRRVGWSGAKVEHESI